MKKIIIVLTFLGLLSSCSNDDDNSDMENVEVVEQNVTLRNTENFEYDLGHFGFEEGASIQTQAEHFEISEIEELINSSQRIYKYKPVSDYVGADYVEIYIGRGSDGGQNPIISLVKITFEITE